MVLFNDGFKPSSSMSSYLCEAIGDEEVGDTLTIYCKWESNILTTDGIKWDDVGYDIEVRWAAIYSEDAPRENDIIYIIDFT